MRRNVVPTLMTLILAATYSQAFGGLAIDFDDGAIGNDVGSFYSGLGVTFADAKFFASDGRPGSSGENVIYHSSLEGFPTSSSPIVATFAAPQISVFITAIDVGVNGARMDAFDAAVGGNLVDSDQFVGSDLGLGVFTTLRVSDPSIRRIELFQPFSVLPPPTNGDGVLFDNLSANAVPEPSALLSAVLMSSIVGCGIWARRRFA